jgi:hypothetical protein
LIGQLLRRLAGDHRDAAVGLQSRLAVDDDPFPAFSPEAMTARRLPICATVTGRIATVRLGSMT